MIAHHIHPNDPEHERVYLEMTHEEATLLRNLVGSIGGDPDLFPERRVVNAVYNAFRNAGIRDTHYINLRGGNITSRDAF